MRNSRSVQAFSAVFVATLALAGIAMAQPDTTPPVETPLPPAAGEKAFDANGIQFAFPTVQVAGGTDAVGAAVRQSLDMLKPVPEA